METQAKIKPAPKSAPKPKKAQNAPQPSKMLEGLGWLKGKIHYDNSVFNLER